MESPVNKIIPIDINKELRRSFLDYSMSVIVSRALPDVRDGLKPVHRRILYALRELGMNPDKPHRKSAYLVGEVLGKYHPHGDTAVYDAMVRLAQDFSTRYPLVDGHGNFGSIDGDSAAAMRYTEVRMTRIALEMLADIEKDTVDFRPNYDESREEPTVLPSRIPNLLINGSAGIAVGMATNIPPHNLGEVVDSLIYMIDYPEAQIDDLLAFVKGPDFPTGGIIMGTNGIKSAYTTGRGSIRIRARTALEELPGGKKAIIVTELPYQVNKARLVGKIAELVREKRLEGITDLRDESDRSGMRIVIEMRRDIIPRVLLNQLFKYTQMEDTFGVIMLALVQDQPRILNLQEALFYYLEHRKDVTVRRTNFELRKAEERLHIVEGLRIALQFLDEVIQTIRQSRTPDIARKALMERFELSEIQAQAILDMRLQRLTGLEREKLEEEYAELVKTIAELQAILADEKKVLAIIRSELLQSKKVFGDARRTQISQEEDILDLEDLIPDDEVVITITHQGYIKRLLLSTYRSQRRGGRGITGIITKNEDFVEHLFITTNHQYLLFFTNRGKVYRLKGYEIPEGGRQAKGTSAVNLLNLTGDEFINAVIPVKEFPEDQYLVMGTRGGIIKKTKLSQYRFTRRDGIIAIQLDEDDELIGVKLTHGQEQIIMVTRGGMAIRFSEKDVRSMGRVARGVRGIRLRPKDEVVSMDIVQDDAQVLAVTENGFGKRTAVKQYRPQRRAGLGIIALKRTPKSGNLVAIKLVHPEDELMLISHEGIIIRLQVDQISERNRNTQGVTLMKLDPGDKVVAVAKVVNRED
ncbi:MAG: DNA gyrase subunit A [Syntrophomonadaceae bacterium]|nr:DNA gyrase subunit A [Syntrophomonadaceae bacterium]